MKPRTLSDEEIRATRLNLMGRQFQVALLFRPQTQQRRDWLERNLRRWRRLIKRNPPFHD